MARRVHISTDRAVITLPGYDAPNPPLEGLSFDSSWPFTGFVMSRGIYVDPAPAHPEESGQAAAPGFTTTAYPTYSFPLQRSRDGYSHYLVLIIEVTSGVVQRQRVFRGSRADAVSLVVPRKYIELQGRPGEIRATGYERFKQAVGFLVIAA